jgi:hypothetical protein
VIRIALEQFDLLFAKHPGAKEQSWCVHSDRQDMTFVT